MLALINNTNMMGWRSKNSAGNYHTGIKQKLFCSLSVALFYQSEMIVSYPGPIHSLEK